MGLEVTLECRDFVQARSAVVRCATWKTEAGSWWRHHLLPVQFGVATDSVALCNTHAAKATRCWDPWNECVRKTAPGPTSVLRAISAVWTFPKLVTLWEDKLGEVEDKGGFHMFKKKRKKIKNQIQKYDRFRRSVTIFQGQKSSFIM